MFSKKSFVGIKKSTAKIQDVKKDLATRQKHLKIILDNVDLAEAKGVFEANFSHIYHILYDSFIQAETNLRQRELSFHLVHKAHKEELDTSLWILEQVLCLLPELIHKRWQLHSLGRLLSKLLHPGNSIRVRRQAIRYFLMWYQALEENAPDYVDEMFASLVPGFYNSTRNSTVHGLSVFHDDNPVSAPEIMAILPPNSGEKGGIGEQLGKIFLEALLEYMVTTVVKLEWHDKSSHHHRCFHFLLERFKKFYLEKICPDFDTATSLYTPNLDLPVLRKSETETVFVSYRVVLIKWIATYMNHSKKNQDVGSSSLASVVTNRSSHQVSQDDDGQQHESAHPSLDSNISVQTTKTTSDEDLSARIVYEVLCSTRDNVNFVHEMYRQAFLLNFTHNLAVRKTISVYKDLIQMNVPEMPPYMLEPQEETTRTSDDGVQEAARPVRLRNDSYLGAIHKENLLVRAGTQNFYQLFMTHAANVFMLEVNSQFPALLEEQTDACKRVMNIYRYMVMHTRMDSNTWEQLLLVLLQITSVVLGENPPKKKSASLGGKLAPAIFQTLIVTWIKANLNVVISSDLWDRFLLVLTSLTNWEELVQEWAKTLETLTRVLARQVYNLDLTDLPLDRLTDQKNRRSRRVTSRPESATACPTGGSDQMTTVRPDTTNSDVRVRKNGRADLPRSYSESNLAVKQRSSLKISRKSHSLDHLPSPEDFESMDRTRSPSPAPSSGLENTSVKDSPIQLDVLSGDHATDTSSGEDRGVVCGGTVRGWLPDVAVILWKRMLGALGDVNRVTEPRLHGQIFEHLVKLTDTLIRIKNNQGISNDNQSTPQTPEFVPPLTLVLPWCFEALSLPDSYETGKINSLRLLCTVMINCDMNNRNYLPQFYRCLHFALSGKSQAFLNTCLRYLGPRFLSLQLPGSSILMLDVVQACNLVLNSEDISQNTPRTEAVSILANMLSLPDDVNQLCMLQPEPHLQVMSCPDMKEHVVSILLRTGKREPTGMARCIALTSLGLFAYRELTNQTFHPKVSDAINVLLLALQCNNKVIAHLVSNTLFLLCDHASLLWSQYPRLADAIISALCKAIFLHTPLGFTAGENDKTLGTALLLCLGEWCMRLGPNRLLEASQHYADNRGDTCLLLQVFEVLHTIITGKPSDNPAKLMPPNPNEGFDPCILLDNVDRPSPPNTSPTKHQHCQQTIALCAKTVLAHLVTHLGHFPMAIGAARLNSLVAEHDDVPNLHSDELSANIFTAGNIQMFILTPNVIASLVELPALELPGGGVTAGLATADKQVRVILRDLSGKACWDASILYHSPEQKTRDETRCFETQEKTGVQLESMLLIGSNVVMQHLPQRAMRHRPPGVLPDFNNAAPDLDQLDDLLQYLGHTSPECLENCDRKLNEPTMSPVSNELEEEAIASVINQRNCESDHSKLIQTEVMMGQPVVRPAKSSASINTVGQQQGSLGACGDDAVFQKCRLFFSQLGLTSWERRQQVHLLNKTERLLRELRNLDLQSCRETHKVAVIYVAPGQEDKNSILSNQGGSAAYEQFLASLAWEVELESHTGFLGGLQRQGSTGLSAPYVATSFYEAIFHVATRMPNNTPDAVLNKIRHLGNDEVHVVWSEHYRDYRRDIIPTEFCDILIVIYPLGNNLNRVTINCKPEVPLFGILIDEAIVESTILAGLIRTAAICASRAKRSTLSFYQQYYEERARSLETVVSKHKDNSTYEQFIAHVYSPVVTRSPFCGQGGANIGAGDSSVCSSNPSMLAAALLDSHKTNHREHKFRMMDSAKGVWFNNPDVSQNVESASISPRPLKKLSTSLKGMPKRTLRSDASLDSPPDSPTQLLRKK